MKIYSYKKGSISYEKNLIQALDIDLEKDKIITLVGAGGKTSTIFELGKEFSNLNKKTIITTTTHMGFDKDFILIEKDSDIKRIKNIMKNFFLIKVGKKESEYKVKSLDFDLLKKIILLGDFILIEGDGSKNLPLKAPKDNEPVIIKETNLVIGIMGFDSINKKIKDICHRPELVSKVLRKDLDEIIKVSSILLIALMPFVWYIILKNHSQMHCWFTYRNLSITVYTVLAFIGYSIDSQKLGIIRR